MAPGRVICAEVSRVVVDVDRYADDALEDMAKAGRGVLYTHSHRREPLRAALPPERQAELLDRYYHPHWDRLRRAARDAVLIDLHAYPREPWPVEPNPTAARPKTVLGYAAHLTATAARPKMALGYAAHLTPGDWLVDLECHFEIWGPGVGLNVPHAGVIDAGAAAAVMIAIRRDFLGSPDQPERWDRLVRLLSEMPLPSLLPGEPG